jgi:cobalt/nickel transport system permease protein
MHIADGVLSTPVAAATAAVSVGFVAAALWWTSRRLEERQVPVLGTVSAFVFAAQMFNFPIVGGTSGHFMGGALAAIVLGPLQSVLVLAVVLTIQCIAFQDGGITALGANVMLMGVVGGLAAWLVFRGLKAVLPANRAGLLAAAAVASWTSIVVASGVCALLLWVSGRFPLMESLAAMMGWHALIGVGEAAITCSVLSLMSASRPDLIAQWPLVREARA